MSKSTKRAALTLAQKETAAVARAAHETLTSSHKTEPKLKSNKKKATPAKKTPTKAKEKKATKKAAPKKIPKKVKKKIS